MGFFDRFKSQVRSTPPKPSLAEAPEAVEAYGLAGMTADRFSCPMAGESHYQEPLSQPRAALDIQGRHGHRFQAILELERTRTKRAPSP